MTWEIDETIFVKIEKSAPYLLQYKKSPLYDIPDVVLSSKNFSQTYPFLTIPAKDTIYYACAMVAIGGALAGLKTERRYWLLPYALVNGVVLVGAGTLLLFLLVIIFSSKKKYG